MNEPRPQSEDERVVPFRRNYGTKEHPCSVPPPTDPKPDIPDGAEPLGDDWEPI